jgi:hypothetical protein
MRFSILTSLALLSALATSAHAQGDFTFQIDSAATGFTWSGTTSLGDITEQPPNFTLTGTSVVTMGGGGNPVGSGAFPGAGDAVITPNISGEIPNPFPFLPPLATLDLTNVHLNVSSPSFTVNGTGAFSTMVTINITSGTLTVDDLTGGHSVTPLGGMSSAPTPANGTLTWSGSEYVLTAPVNAGFNFAASGVSGSITLNGTIVGRHLPEAPSVYCASGTNSTGFAASISHLGGPSLGTADLVLDVVQLPSNVFGLFFYGPNQATIPFGDGVRCVDGGLQRLDAVNTGILGTVSQAINTSTLPATSPVAVGDRRNFQFWYRDTAAALSGFNTSSAMTVLFTP